MFQTEYVTKTERFFTTLLADRLRDINFIFGNEDFVHVTYKLKDYYVQNNHVLNIVIAAFSTANARLRLYEKLEK